MNRRTQFKEKEQFKEPREQTREPKEQFKEPFREHKEPVKEHKEPVKEQPKEILKTFLNKEIFITLRSGNKMNGKLEMVTHFEIIISVDQKPLLVMKHAIDYVELTG